MIQQAIDNMDENVIRQCWVKSDFLPAPQQAKVNSNIDQPTSNVSLDEAIDIELSSIVESLDLTKLGEGDISAKELINIDSMDNEIMSQELKEGNDKPIENMVSNLSCPSLATAQAAILTLKDYANYEGEEISLHNIELLKQIMPSEPKQVSVMNFLHRNKFYNNFLALILNVFVIWFFLRFMDTTCYHSHFFQALTVWDENLIH
jgi:hypothetical protein